VSDKHPEIECYECGRLKTRLIWNSRCVTCTVQRLEANLEENNNLRDQLAALKEENERLKARVAELEKAVTAVDELICHSSGVSGLHLNGEMAPWGDLLEGGHYDSWLIDFSAALKEPSNDD